MNLHRQNRSESAGSLLGVLIVMAVVGTGLGSYLTLVYNQNLSTIRSQNWNMAIPVAEAGVEEALTHLHYHFTNLETQGWVLIGTNYFKERWIGTNRYRAYISTSTPPIIISKGYVREARGTNFMPKPRTLQIMTTNDALFSKGIVAKGSIDLSGNSLRIDSFDSADPLHSTGGQYDPAKAKDNGDVATDSEMVDSLDVWNAEIYGHASTGPGGTVRLGPNGSVGNKAWHDAGSKGIQPGWSTDDMNVDFATIVPPFTGGVFGPPSGSVLGVGYTYVLGSDNYQLTTLSLSGQQKMVVTGQAVLYVSGDISLGGQASITILPGASLTLYAAGANTSLGGNGVINQNTASDRFIYYGLGNNTSISMSGNASFAGAIYAPNAAFTMGGGGNSSYGFVGACVTASVRLNGNCQFHYDENLARVGPKRGYTVTG